MEGEKKNKIGIEIGLATMFMLLILLLVFFVHESKSLSQDEIQKIMERTQSYKNYSYQEEILEGTSRIGRKIKAMGTIIITETDNEYTWTNLETKERITISKQDKTAIIEEAEKANTCICKPWVYQDYEYKYMGDEENKDKKIAYLEYKSEEYYIDVTIDLDTGVNMQEKFYQIQSKIKKGELKKTRKIIDFTLNQVTPEEVQRPDLSGYMITDKRGE